MIIACIRKAVPYFLRTALFPLLLAAAALSTVQGEALAHAALVHADPEDGAVVATPPKSFVLTFSEPVSPIVLKLTEPGGDTAVLDHFMLHDSTLDIEAPAGLGGGTYVLNWRVISEDGHPVSGSAVFSIGAPGAQTAPAAAGSIDWPVRVAIWLARIALYAGLFIGVGGAFFRNWIGEGSPAASRIALLTVLVGLIAAPLSVGLQGLDALGLSLPGIGQAITWRTGLSTTYGTTAAIAAAALAAGAIATVSGPRPGKLLSLVGLLAIGAALAASGHASAAQPQWVTRPAVFLHGVGIAFWAGALVPLGAAFAARSREAPAILRRFSRAIPLAVLALTAAGIVLAVIQMQSVEALWTTAYGRVLTAKLCLLVVLFLLAAVNRFWLTGPAGRGDRAAELRLRRSIRAEIALVLAIFAVAGLWRFTPPPRALAEAAAAPASVHIQTGKTMAELTITPGHAGSVSASIMIMTGDFKPLDAREVTLVLSNPAAGIEQIRRPAARNGDGTWRADNLALPVPGKWTARIDILISDFELAKLEGAIEIRP